MNAWVDRAGRDAIIRYEELIEDPVNIVAAVLRRLGVNSEMDGAPPPSFQELHATAPWFFRKGKPGSWCQEMPSHLHDLFLERHGDTLLGLGYSDRISDRGIEERWSRAEACRRAGVIEDLSRQLQASEADRAARLSVISDLSAKLAASEADRAARLSVIEDLSSRLAASEADPAARLSVISDLSAKLAASEADRAARLSVISDLSAKLAASEADRAARLQVIRELSSKAAALEDECRYYRKTLEPSLSSALGRLARLLGTQLTSPNPKSTVGSA